MKIYIVRIKKGNFEHDLSVYRYLNIVLKCSPKVSASSEVEQLFIIIYRVSLHYLPQKNKCINVKAS